MIKDKDIKKLYEKSNKICTRCGQRVYIYDNFYISLTKSHSYVVCHKKCI